MLTYLLVDQVHSHIAHIVQIEYSIFQCFVLSEIFVIQ